jgi:hypothetical protein
MPTAPKVRQLLDDVQPVHEAARELRRRWEELLTVEQADRAYQELVAEATKQRDDLRRRRDELERAWRRHTAPEEPDAELASWEPAWGAELWRWQPSPQPAPPPEPQPVAGSQARRRLGRLVMRFRDAWRLEAVVLGLVNQIVAEEHRPLGEALALLPWTAFAEPGGDGPADHRARLAEWRQALVEYRDWLGPEVNRLETQTRGSLGIWELWRDRERDAEGKERWESFITETRRVCGEEAERLRQEVRDLEARLRGAGGQP